jgi:hypothetical protein
LGIVQNNEKNKRTQENLNIYNSLHLTKNHCNSIAYKETVINRNLYFIVFSDDLKLIVLFSCDKIFAQFLDKMQSRYFMVAYFKRIILGVMDEIYSCLIV